MKIGAFSQQSGVSKDTIRYYVGEGLLFPECSGRQMQFSERDLEDLNRIQQLKSMRFSIQEIKSVLQIYRMSNVIEPSTIEEYDALLQKKESQLREEQLHLKESLDYLAGERSRLARLRNMNHPTQSGVPLSAVSLLQCPHCHKQLQIEQAEIRQKYIHQGKLSCACGYRADIRDGVVCTGNVYTGAYDQPDLKRELYHDTGNEWDICMQKCTDLMLKQIHPLDLDGKVIFEANINGFFFTYHFLRELPKNALYIFVDKYEEILRMYKKYIEILCDGLEVLYIADAGENYPLKNQCIDLQLGFMGENEYTFYHKQHQIFDIQRLLKPGSQTIQVFSSCEIDSQTRQRQMLQYPEGGDRRGNISYLVEDYKACGCSVDLIRVGEVLHTKKHHSYQAHVDGEALTLYVYHAQMK